MSDKNNIIFERFRELVDKSELSRQEVADGVGCELSLVTKHYNKVRSITTDYVIKYAKFFNVSADYLLGLSDAPTADPELKAVCDSTGLSEDFIDFILWINEMDEEEAEEMDYSKEAFFDVINSEMFRDFLFDFTELYRNYASIIEAETKCVQEQKELSYKERVLVEEDYHEKLFHAKERKDLYLYRTLKLTEKLLIDLTTDKQEQIDKIKKEIEESNNIADPDLEQWLKIKFENDMEETLKLKEANSKELEIWKETLAKIEALKQDGE